MSEARVSWRRRLLPAVVLALALYVVVRAASDSTPPAKYKPDAAFGVANMRRATFDEVKKGRDLADRSRQDLPDDRDLAIEAEAWYLHDLAAQLPLGRSTRYSEGELPALGYNMGAGDMSAFARGATPGGRARAYLEELHANWALAGRALGEG
ncbi:hypothetical protein [Streptomyces griseorubiginosus]|uniref:hypothetical protein n=1 Tax=Streptomyces griseorubiginosus TaxID=67304 RepID=UPI0033F64A05